MSKRQRPRLGRGLSSLVDTSATPTPSQTAATTTEQSQTPQPASPTNDRIREQKPSQHHPINDQTHPRTQPTTTLHPTELPVNALVPGEYQPRSDAEHTDLTNLAASIASAGVVQPIIVRPHTKSSSSGGVQAAKQGETDARDRRNEQPSAQSSSIASTHHPPAEQTYEIVAGERRWRAAILAGLETVPVVIKHIDDRAAAEAALIENVHRQDLNAIDRAHALQRLANDFNLNHADVAQRVGLERSSVTNLIRILDLDHDAQHLIATNALTLGHAKALLTVNDPATRSKLATAAVDRRWSVRELERRAKDANTTPPILNPPHANQEPAKKPAAVADLEQRLAQHLGAEVTIRTRGTKKHKGRIEIAFYDLDHFDGLMKALGLNDAL